MKRIVVLGGEGNRVEFNVGVVDMNVLWPKVVEALARVIAQQFTPIDPELDKLATEVNRKNGLIGRERI